MGAREIDEPYGNVSQRRHDVLVVPEHTAKAYVPEPLRPGMAWQTVRRRQQLDADARSFFGSVLHDTLDGYEVVFVAKPVLPRWAQALGAKPVRVHESVGYWQWVLRRKDLRSAGDARADCARAQDATRSEGRHDTSFRRQKGPSLRN